MLQAPAIRIFPGAWKFGQESPDALFPTQLGVARCADDDDSAWPGDASYLGNGFPEEPIMFQHGVTKNRIKTCIRKVCHRIGICLVNDEIRELACARHVYAHFARCTREG